MTCLSAETLAALAAGQMSKQAREAAEAHLVTCDDCREVFADVLRMAPASPAAPTAAIYWGWRTYTSFAAAAVVVLAAGWAGWGVWQSPDRQLTRAVTQLAQAVGSDRSVEARVHGGFQYGPPPVTTRGSADAPLPLDAQQAALTIRQLAGAHRTVRALDALGVATLMEGDVDAAILALEEAVSLDSRDGRSLADLAAARSERWRRSRAPIDAALALDAAERALLIATDDPVVRFNHALAVEALGLRELAIAGWRRYLEVDAVSEWATEARAHLARLQQPPSPAPAPAGGPGEAPSAVVSAAMIAAWPAARRECWQQAEADLRTSRVSFTASRTAEAEQLARRAREAVLCAAMPTYAADAQIAWTMFFQDRLPPALALADDVVVAAIRAGDWDSVGRMHYISGLAHNRAGRISDADARFEQAIDAFERSGDREQVATTWVMRSEVSKYSGDRAGMWARLARGLGAVDQLSPRRQYMTFANAVIAAERFGLLGAARFFADALVQVSEHSGDPARLVGAYLQSANARIALGEAGDAEAVLARATAVFPKIADAALRAQYGAEVDTTTGRILEQTRPERAIEAYSGAMQVFGDTGRSFRRARLLLGRGRAHQARGDARAAERDWREGVGIFEDQRPEIRDAQWRIDHFDQLWDLFRELILVNADDALASLEIAERFRGRVLLDARAKAAPVATPRTGTALYAWLPSDVTVVAYAVLPRELFRWTVTRDRVTLDRLPVTSEALARLVDEYVSRLAQHALETTPLSPLLLPGDVVAGATRRLVFMPDGPLHRVPFATLTVPATARLVIDDFIPMVAPSLSTLQAVGHSGASRPPHTLLVAAGDAQPREGLPALPGVVAEVSALRALYPAADVLVGSGVTASALSGAMGRAEIIHFAGHAVADAVSPRRSRLLLSATATPSALTFEDLRSVPLRPGALVVLSACDGARGRVVFGEGAIGLPHVLLAGGASVVVAALWQVDDAAPLELWEHFYRRVQAGDDPEAALASSQRRSRNAGTSPALWAAFEAVGGLVQR